MISQRAPRKSKSARVAIAVALADGLALAEVAKAGAKQRSRGGSLLAAKAKLRARTAILAVHQGAHGTVNDASGIYDGDEMIALTAAPDPGFELADWKVVDANNPGVTFSGGTANPFVFGIRAATSLIVTPVFKVDSLPPFHGFVQTIEGKGKVTGGISVGFLPDGMVVTLTAVPAAGYAFRGWHFGEAPAGTDPTLDIVVNREVNVRAVFTPRP